MFHNPGTLKLSLEEIYEGGNSKARNPRMQDMLRMIGFGENLGSGFPKIIDVWKSVKWDAPVLEDRLSLNEVRLTLPVPFRKKTPHFIKDFIKEQEIQLTERQEEILQLISKDATITSQKISQKNSATQRTIIKDMNVLQEYGLLTRIGGKKDGYWKAYLPSDTIEDSDI